MSASPHAGLKGRPPGGRSQSIRAGLVFALKEAVGTDLIAAREEHLWRHVLRRWDNIPAIEVLGNHQSRRLSIISFRIRYGARYLHHNFVVAVLNDWARINLKYFISPATANYIAAVQLIAADGYRLPDYRFDPHTGLWHHRDGPPCPQITLREVAYGPDGNLTYPSRHGRAGEEAFASYLRQARAVFSALPRYIDDGPTGLSPEFETLRWFPLPPACLPAQSGDVTASTEIGCCGRR